MIISSVYFGFSCWENGLLSGLAAWLQSEVVLLEVAGGWVAGSRYGAPRAEMSSNAT
jgi:hypothetical protein